MVGKIWTSLAKSLAKHLCSESKDNKHPLILKVRPMHYMVSTLPMLCVFAQVYLQWLELGLS